MTLRLPAEHDCPDHERRRHRGARGELPISHRPRQQQRHDGIHEGVRADRGGGSDPDEPGVGAEPKHGTAQHEESERQER
ncbi:MAG TPA: hypothetical protein VH700_04120, partial [Gemmatimonadales bacterium]